MDKFIKNSIISLVILTILFIGFIGFLLWKKCEPWYLSFGIYFDTPTLDRGTSILVDNKSTDQFIPSNEFDHDPYTFTDEGDISVWVLKEAGQLNMSIGEEYASCDANDSYTDLNPEKVEASLNGKKISPDYSSEDLWINHSFPYINQDYQEETLNLSYHGAFKTKRNLRIFWLNKEEFEKRQLEMGKQQ